MPLPDVRFLHVIALLLSTSIVLGQTAEEKQEAQKLYREATTLERSRDFAGAVGAIAKALELTPKNDLYLAYASKVEFLAGMTKEAMAHGVEANELKPGNADYLVVVMRGTLAAKDLDTAKAYAEKIIALGTKAPRQLVTEARAVVAKVEFPNTDPIVVAVRYASPEKVKSIAASVRASAKSQSTIPIHRDRLMIIEPLARTAELDLQAIVTPKSAQKSLDDLATYLSKFAKTDAEKARILFRWMADRIEFDDDMFQKALDGDKSPETFAKNEPEAVLKSQRCICRGFARMFEEVGKQMGLEVAFISGHLRTHQFPKRPIAHAWNAVKIGNQWRIVDCTLARTRTQLGSQKQINNYYFFAAPEKIIFSHFPEESKWQLLEPAITREDFDNTPYASHQIFDLQNDVVKVRAAIRAKGFRSFVEIFFNDAIPYRMIDGPISGHIYSGKKYRFQFEAPEECASLALVLNDEVFPLTRNGLRFEGQITPRLGTMYVKGSLQSAPANLRTLLKYEVE